MHGGSLSLFGKSKPKLPPLHAGRIEDYALIGDCETGALVSRDGSIDWLCWPNFSSAACFAALLGTAENGYWRLQPVGEIKSITRRYRPGTMILETTFVTEDGEVCLTDFMPPRGEHSDVVRIISGIRGKVKMRMELVIRFDYGLTIPWVTAKDDELRAVAGPNMVVLRAECPKGDPAKLHGEDMTTVSEFTLKEGHRTCFVLTYGASNEDVPRRISPHRRHRRCHHRGSSGKNRRRAQLGLPLLLAPRHFLHPPRSPACRLHRRSHPVAPLVAARHRRRT
jgi:GH15 family glucan-1,4-alpha-glucosidase